MKRLSLMVALLSGLAGCASLPESLRDAPEEAPSLTEVRRAPEEHEGERVLWGGTIAGVENREEATLLEVVARPLADDGRPHSDTLSPGRFLARVEGFLDPAVFEDKRLITVVGTVDGTVQRPIGEYPYRYVAVEVESYHLWSPRPVRRAAPPPGYGPWYDPWYGPWYDPWYDPWRYPYRY